MMRTQAPGTIATMDSNAAGDGYRVTVEGGEKYWLLEVGKVDRVTQARTLAEMDPMARDLVACMTDLEPSTIRLIWVVTVRPERWEDVWELYVGEIGVTQCLTLDSAERLDSS